MFPIATIISSQSGRGSFYNGVLIQLPLELRDAQRLNAYSQINKPGWGRSAFGYHYFSCPLPSGELLIFPGLIIEGKSGVEKRFHGYKHVFTTAQIESLATGVLEIAVRAEQSALSGQVMLVHDLRALSNTIYNSAFEGQRLLVKGDVNTAKIRLDNVLAAQGILRMRIDALEFDNIINNSPSSPIAVFKKVDKVVRCFRVAAESRYCRLNLNGSSFYKVVGPDVLELVPYALLDNALKYCPEGTHVDIEVKDTNGTTISVSSLGPEIATDEKARIFVRGVRGLAAEAATSEGSGLGLYMVARIVKEVFNGQINVMQVPVSINYDGAKYYQTTFEVFLPSFPLND